ncbi:hypothetical protein KC946_02635 [Candidatus Saccharibacteria bacterium]|nr:hypothetical protein [Candidatus Saccharibacteria bacterium]
MKIHNNQKGFGILGGLLVLVIIGVLGGVGWYVWNNRGEDSSTSTENTVSQTSSETDTEPAPEADPTESWVKYTSEVGKFSIKYPSDWSTASNPELCSPNIFLLGVNDNAVGKCASDSGGQIAIYSNEGNNLEDSKLKKADYSDLATESVTIGDVQGIKQTGTYSGDSAGIGPSKGDKTVVYMFYTNNRTYTAAYNIQPDYPDAIDDFNILVIKTLQFLP